MPRGKARRKLIIEYSIDKNRSAFAKVWLDTKRVDISYPDRSIPGFYLAHVKNLTLEDAEAIRCCLNQLYDEGVLDG